MARGGCKHPKRGGGGPRGGAPPAVRTAAAAHVARPRISELPTSLVVNSSAAAIPAPLVSEFPEFKHAQPYFSALERLNPELAGSIASYKQCWTGISGECILGVKRVNEDSFGATLECTNGTSIPLFVKRIHLLDPMSAMKGDYVWPEEGALPAPSDLWKHALAKLNDPMNEAYVDALFALTASRLVETGVSPHWLKCFGTYNARVDKYLYNITDEYSSLRVKPWWRRNQRNGLFSLYKDDDTDGEESSNGFMTSGLQEMENADFEELEIDTAPSAGENTIIAAATAAEPELENTGAETVHLSAPRLRLKRLSHSVGSTDSGNSDDSESEDEIQQFVEFNNFPVQVTFLEHAEGTMDELLDEEDEEDAKMLETKEMRWSAWLFQVIAALTTAQYYFGFVHNDLHTNNVMWTSTEAKHLYYRVHKGKETFILAVPTYGKLMKIIDFGRASYHLPDPAGFFISDAFYPGNDAATQYNCEPFYDPKEGKKVEPNTSFDLCRLSVSLIETLYPDRPDAAKPTKIMSREGGKLYSETVSGVYNMLWEWLLDDEGKNVLRQPDGEERYPDFDLYRALAADVHRAVPAKQIERALFHEFKCTSVPSGETVYDLYI